MNVIKLKKDRSEEREKPEQSSIAVDAVGPNMRQQQQQQQQVVVAVREMNYWVQWETNQAKLWSFDCEDWQDITCLAFLRSRLNKFMEFGRDSAWADVGTILFNN